MATVICELSCSGDHLGLAGWFEKVNIAIIKIASLILHSGLELTYSGDRLGLAE